MPKKHEGASEQEQAGGEERRLNRDPRTQGYAGLSKHFPPSLRISWGTTMMFRLETTRTFLILTGSFWLLSVDRLWGKQGTMAEQEAPGEGLQWASGRSGAGDKSSDSEYI